MNGWCFAYTFILPLKQAAYSLRYEGIFTRSIIKTPVSPCLSVTVHPLCSRGGYQLSPLPPGPRPWAVSEPLHPFLLVTQPVTSATLAVTHHRYPRDRLHENITQCDRFQEMKSGARVRSRVTRPGWELTPAGVNSVILISASDTTSGQSYRCLQITIC